MKKSHKNKAPTGGKIKGVPPSVGKAHKSEFARSYNATNRNYSPRKLTIDELLGDATRTYQNQAPPDVPGAEEDGHADNAEDDAELNVEEDGHADDNVPVEEDDGPVDVEPNEEEDGPVDIEPKAEEDGPAPKAELKAEDGHVAPPVMDAEKQAEVDDA